MLSSGSAQNGCSMLVVWSPYATVMTILPTSVMPTWAAVCSAIGPWIAHCAPPDGTKKLMRHAAKNDMSGIVCAVPAVAKNRAMVSTRPDDSIMAMMPPKSGN